MMKLLAPLALALTTLTGCELYFGGDGDNGDDRWTYCARDGYYECYGDDCRWLSASCPSEPGYECESNADCAAGCYCGADGTCEEAGFCGGQEDCPDGFHCDVERSSCVPDQCTTNADCDNGYLCDEGSCAASCTCNTDAEAQAANWGYCDETRNTCMPPNEGGTCGGTSTCNIIAPSCGAGSVPLILDGCYTGECSTIASCDVTPACTALQSQADCTARTDCAQVVNGFNCTNTNGDPCADGEANCTCEVTSYASCRSRVSGMMVMPTADGQFVNVLSR